MTCDSPVVFGSDQVRRRNSARVHCVPDAEEDDSVVTIEDPPSELPYPASADNESTGLSGTAASVAGDTAGLAVA